MALRFRILATGEGTGATEAPGAPGAPGAAFVVSEAPTEERSVEIGSDLDELRIGRRPGVEIELPFPAVSSLHARLFRGDVPGTWWVEDLASMNGSWLEAQRLAPGRPVPVRAGQRLRIATVDLVFEGGSARPEVAESTATMARRLISDLFGAPGGDAPTLHLDAGAAGGGERSLRLALRDHRYTVGRDDACDLVLVGGHVSRGHLAFVRRWNGVVMFDMGPKNGVLVNGAVAPQEMKLSDGDRLQVGPLVLAFSDPEDAYLRRLKSLEAGNAAEASVASASTPASTSTSTSTSTSVAAALPAAPPRSDPTSRSSTPIPTPSASSPPALQTVSGRRRVELQLASVIVAAIVLIAVAGLLALLLGLV